MGMNKTLEELDSSFASIQRIVNEHKNPYSKDSEEYAEFEKMKEDIIVSCMDLNMYIGNFIEKTV